MEEVPIFSKKKFPGGVRFVFKLNEEQQLLKEAAGKVSEIARERAFSKNLPVVIGINGKVVQIFRDGTMRKYSPARSVK